MILGGVVGLLYGWVVNPASTADTSPETLRADYRADYVLMVAESYQAEKDLALATRRLVFLGDSPALEFVSQALVFASQAGYAQADLAVLGELADDLRNLDSAGSEPES